ncbi:hypothetical protein ACHAWF_005531, partial [Thalassiosira exigua]
VPKAALDSMLPLRLTEAPETGLNEVAAAARLRAARVKLFDRNVPVPTKESTSLSNIGRDVTEQIYICPHAYDDAFEEEIGLRKFELSKHRTAGLSFVSQDWRLLLASMSPGTPGAKIPRWRSRIRGAWLRRVGDVEVSSIVSVQEAFARLSASGAKSALLTFSHPEVRHGLSREGLPVLSREEFTQLTADQLNNRWDLPDDCDLVTRKARYNVVDSGNVLNYVTCAMKLTRGRLQRQEDWSDWQLSEYLQLDQYEKQGMFGDPVAVESDEAVVHLVWSYVIKTADGRKKARCTCDGSTCVGQVRVLDYTYANCVDQTSSCLFYAISAAENLLIYGSDVSNPFGEAAPPKQGFYIRPDRAFRDWWVNHKGRKPIPMQGHPEVTHLWEKHANAILREIGLTPTTHEPCLYSGLVDGKRVIFKRQVDDFAATCPDQRTADLLFDMIDERLSIPLKQQGLLDIFNGMDIVQSREFIKVHCKTYIERICEKHLATWMKRVPIAADRPVPLKTDHNYLRRLYTSVGSKDPAAQALLAKTNGLSFRSGIGELIYPMSTCRPDLSFAAIKLSQSSSCPDQLHFTALRHALRYMYATRDYGLHYWRPSPRPELPSLPLPRTNSNAQDLLPQGRSDHDPLYDHGFADSD